MRRVGSNVILEEADIEAIFNGEEPKKRFERLTRNSIFLLREVTVLSWEGEDEERRRKYSGWSTGDIYYNTTEGYHLLKIFETQYEKGIKKINDAIDDIIRERFGEVEYSHPEWRDYKDTETKLIESMYDLERTDFKTKVIDFQTEDGRIWVGFVLELYR